MTRWQVELRGDDADSALLVALFTTPDLRVVRDGDSFLLESSELELLGDASEVSRAAEHVVSRINGAARLQNRSYRNVAVGAVHEHRPDGSRATNVFVQAATVEIRAILPPATVVGGAPSEPVASPAGLYAEAAAQDPDAQEVLDRWANDPHDWANLHKVYEIVENRGGIEASGVSKKQLKRFTHTANHQEGGGRDARHSRLGTKPPKNPMALSEADRLVSRLLDAWLRSLL